MARIKQIPLREESIGISVNGEIVLDRNTGHVSVRDDSGTIHSITKDTWSLLNSTISNTYTKTDLYTKTESDGRYVQLSGSVMTGYLTLAGDPTQALHAVTKQYVDSFVSGLDPKPSVRTATTGAITLSGTQTVDGISLIVGDRILVKDQADNTTNGIYIVQSSDWTRSSDFNGTNNNVTSGAFMFVEQGTVNANSGWILTGQGIMNVGTDSLSFTQFTGLGEITPGTGLAKTGGTIYIDNTGVTVGTYFKVTVNAQGQVTAAENPTTVDGFGITDAVKTTGGTMTGGLTISAGGLSVTGGLTADTMTLNGLATLNGGASIPSGTTLQNAGTIDNTSGTISGGTLSDITINGTSSIGAGSTLTNGGIISGGEIQSASIVSSTIPAGETLTNAGTISGGTISNSTLSGGTIQGSFAGNPTFTGTPAFGQGISVVGGITTDTLSVTGAATFSQGLTIPVGTTMVNNGTISGGIISGATWQDGSITGTIGGTPTYTGLLTLGGGISVSGTATLNSNSISSAVIGDTQPSTNLTDGLIWYAPTADQTKVYLSGQFREIGAQNGQILKNYTNSVTISDSESSVSIGMTFDSTRDIILVFANGEFLQNGEHYSTSTDASGNAVINNLSGSWDPETQFNFIMFENIPVPNQDVLTLGQYTGTVTIAADGTTNIAIPVTQYNSQTDVLDVYWDNAYLYPGDSWQLNGDQVSIDLLDWSLAANEKLFFRVTKKVKDNLAANLQDGAYILDNSIAPSKLMLGADFAFAGSVSLTGVSKSLTIGPSTVASGGGSYGSNSVVFQRSYWNGSAAVTGSSTFTYNNNGVLQYVGESVGQIFSLSQTGVMTVGGTNAEFDMMFTNTNQAGIIKFLPAFGSNDSNTAVWKRDTGSGAAFEVYDSSSAISLFRVYSDSSYNGSSAKKVMTANNILDNGSGSMSIVGPLNISNHINGDASMIVMNYTSDPISGNLNMGGITYQVNGVQKYAMVTQANTDASGNTTSMTNLWWSYSMSDRMMVLDAITGSMSSRKNTLDDGAGNMILNTVNYDTGLTIQGQARPRVVLDPTVTGSSKFRMWSRQSGWYTGGLWGNIQWNGAWNLDDAAKPGWGMEFDWASDYFRVYRAAPGANPVAAPATLFQIYPSGNVGTFGYQTTSVWSTQSGNDSGWALFSNNGYLKNGDANFRYVNTHSSLGARGIMLSNTGDAKTSLQYFDTGSVAATADGSFTPTRYIVWHDGNAWLKTGYNMLVNSTARYGMYAWTDNSGGAITAYGNSPYDGSLFATYVSNTTAGSKWIQSNNIGASGNLPIMVSFMAYSLGLTTGGAWVEVLQYDSSSAYIKTDYIGITLTAGWTGYYAKITTASNCASVQIRLTIGPNSTNTNLAWKNIKVEYVGNNTVPTLYSMDADFDLSRDNSVIWNGSLLSAQGRSSILAWQSTTQTSPAAFTDFAVSFQSTSRDTKSEWDGVNKFTAKESGIYSVVTNVGFTSVPSGFYGNLILYVNGSSSETIGDIYGCPTGYVSIHGSCQVWLNAGDYIKIYANISSASIATTAGSNVTRIEVTRIA